MPFLFQSTQKPDVSSTGFIVAKRPTNYGPGVIILLTLFGLAFVAYAGLYSYRAKILSEIAVIRNHTDDLERSRNKKLETEIFIFEKRINALSQILRSHQYVSQIFPLVESLTLPTIFYDTVNFSVNTQATSPAAAQPNVDVVQVQLSGTMQTLLDLARQMVVFRQDPRIQKGEISSYTLGKESGGITFTALLTFDKKVILAQ